MLSFAIDYVHTYSVFPLKCPILKGNFRKSFSLCFPAHFVLYKVIKDYIRGGKIKHGHERKRTGL